MYRHRYHLSAPQGWLNDPNGFCYYKGRYHFFYQHNPQRPLWGRMYWGHASSTDLISWRHEPIALKPTGFWEAFLGCFSGSAVEKDGKLFLLYTGFSFLGQVQLLAESDDGLHFRKRPWPVIGLSQRPPGSDWLNFRDPKLLAEPKEKGGDAGSASIASVDYLCLLGSSWNFRRQGGLFSRRQRGGQVWLYRSADLLHWTRVASLLHSPLTYPGIFECPDLVRLNGQDLLLASPMFLPANEHDEFENLHSVVAIPGKLDDNGFTPSVATAAAAAEATSTSGWLELDGGSDFYAAQTMQTPDGRTILIAWMQMWKRSMPTRKEGWAGAMTLPRELSWEDGGLRQRPLREIEAYREPLCRLGNLTLSAADPKTGNPLSAFRGLSLELELKLRLGTADSLSIHLFEGGGRYLELSYEKATQTIRLDRSRSGCPVQSLDRREFNGPDIRHTRLSGTPASELELHIFLDQSSAEIFINDGRAVMTMLYYPLEGDAGISLHCDGTVFLEEMEAWRIVVPE